MNQIMSQHELERLHFTDPEFPIEFNCDQHSKLIEFICITCDVQMCSICAVENHRYHDKENLEKYVRIKNNINIFSLIIIKYY